MKGKRLAAIGMVLLATVISYFASSIIGFITALTIPKAAFLMNLLVNIFLIPLNIGVIFFFLKLARGQSDNGTKTLFIPYQRCLHYIWVNVRLNIFIFLWTLLFIIPGCIAAMRYALTAFIALDDPELPVRQAMEQSGKLMNGYKLKLFGYCILWGLILFFCGICTLGIALFWLLPQLFSFLAHFYLAVKNAPQTVA